MKWVVAAPSAIPNSITAKLNLQTDRPQPLALFALILLVIAIDTGASTMPQYYAPLL